VRYEHVRFGEHRKASFADSGRSRPKGKKRALVALIEIRDVCKTYDLGEVKVEALRNASLTIEQGEYVAIIGPSGSGKSTLMNMLGCLDRPTSGSYKLGGEEVATMSADERASIRNRRIGFVFQNFNLLARTTALENVELPMLYAKGVSASERRRRALEKLELVGLGNRLDHHPTQLSGGQQQRVAIARALVQEPDIVLADEPTASLDPHNTRVVMDALQRINRHFGITVICNLHSLELARAYCDRLVGMAAGRVVFDDVTSALTDEAARELYGIAADGSGQDDAAVEAAATPVGAVGQVAT
jgi:putative ABC transport system ATP-binding protein